MTSLYFSHAHDAQANVLGIAPKLVCKHYRRSVLLLQAQPCTW